EELPDAAIAEVSARTQRVARVEALSPREADLPVVDALAGVERDRASAGLRWILVELLARQPQRVLRVGLVEQRRVQCQRVVRARRPDQSRAQDVASRAAVLALAVGGKARRVGPQSQRADRVAVARPEFPAS